MGVETERIAAPRRRRTPSPLTICRPRFRPSRSLLGNVEATDADAAISGEGIRAGREAAHRCVPRIGASEMADGGSLVPISDEQAKAIQEALKTLQRTGGFLKETLGTVPQDLVGYLGGDWLRVRTCREYRANSSSLSESRAATSRPMMSRTTMM
jgi:hypothetical protein